MSLAVARELTMPKLSDSMADAVILRWLKAPGEAFERGEALIEVETDKATVVYEAEWAGTLATILVPEGETVAVGQAIATLANGGRSGADGQPASRSRSDRAVELVAPAPAPAFVPAAAGRSPGDRVNATPLARRAAAELGVSLHGVGGSGPGGRVTVEDVRSAAAVAGTPASPEAAAAKGEVQLIELSTTQSTIARRMVESASTVPVFTVSIDADVSEIVTFRQQARDGGSDPPSLNDFVVKAAAAALREFPRFNASYVDGRIECYSRIHIGVAVATDEALLVPVVRDADEKSLSQIAAETKRLAEAARGRTLTPADLHGGTFTVSNLGMYGVASFTAIVDLPQVAILAVGGARRAPVEDGSGGVAFRDLLTLSLTCDHRVVYGADGAQFLSRIRDLLEHPLALTV